MHCSPDLDEYLYGHYFKLYQVDHLLQFLEIYLVFCLEHITLFLHFFLTLYGISVVLDKTITSPGVDRLVSYRR